MGISEVDRPIWILRGLVIVAILCSGLCVITDTVQGRMALLTAQVVPFAIALYGLWRFKYWAWIVALIVSFYDLTGLLFYIFNWSDQARYIHDFFHQHPIKGIYFYVGHYAINFFILLLLIIERDSFDE
jgi:hypothetical protein